MTAISTILDRKEFLLLAIIMLELFKTRNNILN